MPDAAQQALIDRLLEQVPALRPLQERHLELNGELLPHVFFGEVTRFVTGAFASDEARARAEASQVIAILEVAMGDGNPEVVNLISVSFIENLLAEKAPQRFRKDFGPRLAAEFNEQRDPQIQPVFIRPRNAPMVWLWPRTRKEWCETRGRRVRPMTFEVLPAQGSVVDREQWEFEPGTVVTCQLWNLDGDVCLVAVRVADALPPLPLLNPALRLSTAEEVLSLRRALQTMRPDADLHVADVAVGVPQADPRLLLRDLAVRAYGDDLATFARTEPPDRIWLPISRQDGADLLVRVLSTDMAYHSSVMDRSTATSIADAVLACLGADAQLFVNGTVGSRGFLQSLTPLSDATFETSVGLASPRRVGLVMITDED